MNYLYRLFGLFVLTLAFFLNSIIICPAANALLRQHHETSGVLKYHAQDSLKDKQGNAWQVVLFPENTVDGETKYYLRLVGFPGLVEFVHPQSLEILTSEGKIEIAPDIFADKAPANNVGQYDLTEILPKLGERNLKLSVILQGNNQLSLKIPKAIATEWQWLTRDM
jgi:Protein of unknown function (DUF3122)